MSVVQAVYKGGVFTPKEPVDLPENSEVEFEPRLRSNGEFSPEEKARREEALTKLYEILDRRFDSGETDVAERHNEHQP